MKYSEIDKMLVEQGFTSTTFPSAKFDDFAADSVCSTLKKKFKSGKKFGKTMIQRKTLL